MQKTLVTIIGEHQSEAIKNITLLYTDWWVKLNESSDMETNSFTF